MSANGRPSRTMKFHGGVVHGAQQPPCVPDPVVAPGMRVHERSLDEGEDLTALIVVPIACHPRGSGKARPLQVP